MNDQRGQLGRGSGSAAIVLPRPSVPVFGTLLTYFLYRESVLDTLGVFASCKLAYVELGQVKHSLFCGIDITWLMHAKERAVRRLDAAVRLLVDLIVDARRRVVVA